MTKEKAIKILEIFLHKQCDLERTKFAYDDNTVWTAVKMASEALEHEPCDDEYIKVPKKVLKYRTSGMVAYNAEWLKNHFDIERAVICGAQQPCDDAISRQAVIDAMFGLCDDGENPHIDAITDTIERIAPITPQPKTGQWTRELIRNEKGGCIGAEMICSECGEDNGYDKYMNYCPNCGARMVDTQESEG